MKRYILPLTLTLTILAFFVDNFLLNNLIYLRISFLDYFFVNLAEYFNYFVIGVIITLLALIKKSRAVLLELWVAFISSGILVYLLKLIIQRQRPLSGLIELTSSSFPSGHSAIMFSLLPVIFYNFNKKISCTWLILSIIIAFSRVYLNVHYLSDVFAGIFLGLLIGESLIKLNSLKFRYNNEGY